MCISNNALELQAFHVFEQIQKCSIYNLLKIEFLGGKSLDLGNTSNAFDYFEHPLELITKITLQDHEGNLFYIEPNDKGLKFSKGEITYTEYLSLQKKEDKQFVLLFVILTGSFFITGIAFLKYLL